MAQLNIDDLKAAFSGRGGVHTPNRFEITFNPPGGGGIGGRDLSLLCESTSIPGKQITTFEYPWKAVNNQVKVPNGYMFEDITCSFILTNDYSIKYMFEGWMNTIINAQYRLAYARDYERQITMSALDQTNKKVFIVKLLNAFPITLNSIPLSMATTNETAKIEVTFTYSSYEIV